MGTNRITREYITYLKKKRKKKINIIFSCSAICILIITIIAFSIYNDRDKTNGQEINIGVKADLGINTNTDSYMYSEKEEDINMADIEFSVPKTVLPDVEGIIGANWHNNKKHKQNDNSPIDMSFFNNTVFIGDSRTEGLLLYSGIPNLNGFCYKGLSLDKLDSDASIIIPDSNELFTCYDAISNTDFDNYYCMFGVNELGWVSQDAFIDKFNELIDHIYRVNPDAIVYVESILPVTSNSSAEDEIYTQDRINEYNRLLYDMCRNRGDVIYLDVASSVMDENGFLPDEASTDGIHLSSDYCKRVIQYIRCNTYSHIE